MKAYVLIETAPRQDQDGQEGAGPHRRASGSSPGPPRRRHRPRTTSSRRWKAPRWTASAARHRPDRRDRRRHPHHDLRRHRDRLRVQRPHRRRHRVHQPAPAAGAAARRPRGHRLQPRTPARAACPPACARSSADRKDHAGLWARRLAGERVRRGLRRHLRADPRRGRGRAARRARRARRHVLFVSTGRVYDHALPIPYSTRRRRAASTGATTRRTRSPARTCCCERHRERGPAGDHRAADPRYGPLNTRNNETFFFDRLLRGRPVLVPGPRRLAAPVRPRRGPGRRHGRHARRAGRLRPQPTTSAGEEAITQVGFVELIAERDQASR